eukprot:TRINITY_DN8111_c0_g1_i2.p1 TRINITY_DN8111_c0_g1~~TRINITY_DN8111_c0_g1_i2.p1  ORF type:complete len:313 (+),score=63.39 TRINITY_DN8111_c0_g1_i2:239-1177(+)
MASEWIDWFLNDDSFVGVLTIARDHRDTKQFFTMEYMAHEARWIPLFFILVFLLFQLRLKLDRFVENQLKSGSFFKLTNPSEASMLKECVFYSVYYTTALAYGLGVHLSGEWSIFGNPSAMFKNYPAQPFFPYVRLYFLMELAFYVHALFYTVRFDARRSDWNQFIIHHVSTILVTGCAYYFRQHRASVMILILHNVSDIFLYSAKVSKYLGYAGLTDVLFLLFAVSFLMCRLIGLTHFVIYFTAIEADFLAFRHTQNMLFTILIGLHVFWFGLIIKVARKKFVSGGTVEDLREESTDQMPVVSEKEQNGRA